jgi:hypothetical protein
VVRAGQEEPSRRLNRVPEGDPRLRGPRDRAPEGLATKSHRDSPLDPVPSAVPLRVARANLPESGFRARHILIPQ